MTYKNQLRPWCIIRNLPELKKAVVCRFRHRNDAEGHLLVLKQMIPKISYEIAFDPTGTLDPVEIADLAAV